MLNSTRPAWSKQGYVCRACRRQSQSVHQQRWSSQQHTESSNSAATADSWFDTINDISDQYSSHKPTPPKKPDDEGREECREPRGRRGRLEVRKHATPRSNINVRDLKSLANSLASSVDSAITPVSEDRGTTDDEFKAAFLSGQSRHRDRRKRPEDSSKSHVAVSDLLNELKAGAEARRVRQDEGIELLQEPDVENEEVQVVPEDTSSRPFPTFRGRQLRPIDTVDVPPGKINSEIAGKDATRPRVWKAKTSPSESGLGSHVESRVLSNQPMNLMDRFKETQSRKPWGGASEERASSPPPKATFDTLTKADRITPKKPIETSVAKKPFGVIDSLKQWWRGKEAPKDPMEGLRTRLLATNEAGDSSTKGFSFGVAATDTASSKPSVQSAESNSADTKISDAQSNVDAEADSSVARSLEQTMTPPQEADETAFDRLTKLHAHRYHRHGEVDERTPPAASASSNQHQEAGPKADQLETSTRSAESPGLTELDLTMRKLNALQARPGQSQFATRASKRKASYYRARIRALGGDPVADISTLDLSNNADLPEGAGTDTALSDHLKNLTRDVHRLQALRKNTTSPSLRKTLQRRIERKRAHMRDLGASQQEVLVPDSSLIVEATSAEPTTASSVKDTDHDVVSEATKPSQATNFPSHKVDDISRPAVDDSSLSEGPTMSLADAMKQDAKVRTPRRMAGTRRVSLDKTALESPAEVQQNVEEATPSLAAESTVETEEVEEVEKDQEEDQGRYEQLSVQLSDLHVKPLDLSQPPVPYLEYGLDRVLFNPGVYQLQDAASRVYNFDPYLQKIMPVEQFDFNALKEYKTSSQDTALAEIANQQEKRYIGSTSSMTSSLAHFHYLISNWRPLNLDMLSKGYFGPQTSFQFTKINKAPSAIFLRWKNGSYAIDADKEYDSPNVLMLLGKSMELLLTLPKDEYEKYRKSDPRAVSEEQRTSPESYQYSTMGDFLMRSQLDAYDPRLPGNGTFDLKTRAVVSIRMSSRDHEKMTGYEIYGDYGRWCSYEKEYHDMARATMLKYMLQARMGRMNGIFVAYHNVKRIFGFQYIPISEMDRLLHGQTDPSLGDQEFKASLKIMNDLLNKATTKYPEQSLRIHFEAQESKGDTPPYLHMFAEPMTEDEIDGIQNKNKEKIAEYERNIMGKEDATSTNDKEKASAGKLEEKPAANENDPADDATAYARQLLRSSDAPADKPFLERVETLQASEFRPLFYATVLVQSEINGSVPKKDRPENLKASDEWQLNYLIKDYDITSHEWALYEDMKARRKEALWFEGDEEEIGEGLDGEGNIHPKVEKEENNFLNFLERLSKQGGQVREKMDQADRESGKDKDIVSVDDPLPRVREKVNSVEDYIELMYKREQRE